MIDPIYKVIGDNITKIRWEQKISAYKLCEKTGISQGSIYRIERGLQRLKVHELINVADVLGKDIKYFLEE